jgi:hypothetical protein
MVRVTERLDHLEKMMSDVIVPHIELSNKTRAQMSSDIKRILSVVTGAEKVGGFLKRYGPRGVVFGAGVMTSLGFGNPALLAFLKSFFG